MSKTLRIIGLVFLLVCAATAAWQLRGWRGQEGAPVRARTVTDTVYAERAITRTDTVTETVPQTRTIYETRTDTVRDCYARPEGFQPAGLVSGAPLRVDGGGVFSGPSATLTTWQPDHLRFEQSTYELPRSEWELWPDFGAKYGAQGFSVGAYAHLRWRRLEGFAGYELGERGRRGPAFGLRLRPFTLDW